MEWPCPGSISVYSVLGLTIGASGILYYYVRRAFKRHGQLLQRGIRTVVDCEPPNRRLDVVAVHGLGAHPEFTWTTRGPNQSRVNWLTDLFPRDFGKARVMTFGHNSDWFVRASNNTPFENAKMLLRAVNEARREHHKCGIVFIGHSFGGIIIKEAICLAETDRQYRDILDDTIGIIFLGTPHQGSDIPQFGAMIARLTWVFGSSTMLLKGLYRDNPHLSDLQERFMSVIRRRRDIKLVAMYERLHTYFAQLIYLGFIVERNAAMLDVGENFAVEKDHMGLNKCASRNDPAYDAICQGINTIRDHAERRGLKRKYLEWSERSRL